MRSPIGTLRFMSPDGTWMKINHEEVPNANELAEVCRKQLQTKKERDEAVGLLDCINNGTDCDVTGINGTRIDGILLTREFIERVNKFLKEIQ
jgi:hypothetical protein